MTDERQRRRRDIGWGIGASVLLHVVIAFVLLFRLPVDAQEPPKDESVSVEIVPPPEEAKAQEKKPAEQKPLVMPKFDEAKKTDQAKPVTPPEKQAAKTPEPPKQEAAKKDPLPPKQEDAKKQPPPPPKPEEAKKEPPPPESPKQEAKKPEPPPPPKPEPPKPEPTKQDPPPQDEAKQDQQPGDQQGKGQPLQVLRPVFQFGEKDSGPRKSLTGNAAQDSGASPPGTVPDAKPLTPPPTTAEAAKPADVPPKPVAQDAPKALAMPPGNPVPNDISVPEIAAASTDPQNSNPAAAAAPDATRMALVSPPPMPAAKSPSPSAPTDASKPLDLPKVKTLFSQSETGDAVATTAMGNIPRGVRAGQLCATELRQQLLHQSTSYWPDLLPSYRLSQGTVLDVRRGAFRASSQWYDLSFRCEVDANATKIVSFAFDIGEAVPRGEWRKRGFPDF